MHYLWRGDMPHFSTPLPFQQGRAESCRVLARDLGGPDRGRPRVPGCGSPPTPAAGASSTSAGLSGVPAVVVPRPPQLARRQPWPARAGRQRVPGCGGPPTPTAGAPSTSAGQSGAPARAGLRWSLTPADGMPWTSAGQSRPPAHARPRRSPDPCGGRAVDLGWPDTLADGGQPGAARAAPVRRGVTASISNWPAAPTAGQPKQARAPVGLAPFSTFDSAHNAILR